MKRVSLNIDLGEFPDEPDELYSLATMVNIACGGHAGDRASMQKALRLAQKANARVAAHPSYPDRAGFGRKSLNLPVDELQRSVRDQMSELMSIARDVGVTITAVKPHGALYHDLQTSSVLAEAFLEAMASLFDSSVSVVVIAAPMRSLLKHAHARGRDYLREGFADRTYLPDGSLSPRTQPDALLTNPAAAAAQALRLVETNQFDTLCVHGDTPNALAVARAVREALVNAQALDGG
ncbi:MAG TPA: LamB/YcsF family protein [Polyangium sp.]|nr:LamB/YcsF family protein [Polyangium sp.]